jgi:hypothetical protein
MSANLNRSDVVVDFKDIYGKTINDDVEIKIYNTQLIYSIYFRGKGWRGLSC